jgi:tetratricopeptide (TPR) repeat protein
MLKTQNTQANLLGAQKYLREAVRLDPKFALSWALLSFVDSRGYITTALQPTVALREEARQAAETALTLQPNLGEAILAKGYYHYACLKDYDTAVRYFGQARQFLIAAGFGRSHTQARPMGPKRVVFQRSRAARPAQRFPTLPARGFLYVASSLPRSAAKA